MIQNPSVSARRILNFPAIHPCEEISPKTLLTSLISLASEICSFKSRFFASNDRNAREIIRQIGVLLVFLEEVRGLESDLPDAVVLGFSELHLAFQRVRFLLDDCSREGARVLMLVNSESVADHFRVFARAIATAVDVLPLSLIDAPVDLKEHVELVMRQARKSRFDVAPNDKRVLSVLRSVLNRFEDGVIPDKDDLRLVLDYLGIRRWSKCHKGVKFLGSEIELENSKEEKKDLVMMLSSLMGFVYYCRCVLFDVVDGEANPQLNSKCSSEVLIGLNQDDFRCPISLEIMVDPVTIASGHTYDRSSIAKWFQAGNLTCPKTGEKLKNLEMVPNLALRRLIQQYCFENGIPFVESGHRNRHVRREVFAGISGAHKVMKMVANFLAGKLTSGAEQEKNKAAFEARLISKTSVFNRSCLVEAGVVLPLLMLLSSSDSLTQEHAAAALLNLSKHSESKAIIVNNGGLEILIDVLKKGPNLEARQHAAGVLFYLASVEENRMLIGENPEAIPALMELIENGTNRGKKNALVAIFGLLAYPGNHGRVLAAGAVPLLVTLLKSCETEEIVTNSLAILATLAEKSDGTTAILHHRALDLAVELLNSCASRSGKEYCVSLLLALCKNDEKDVVALLVKSPSLMGSLYSLLSEGTSRASKKASALIRVLHEFHERRSSGLMALVLPRERFVHAW